MTVPPNLPPLERAELPMFPLGSVLVPSMIMPLHIFESRYRVMMDEILSGDRSFGVVLIERGAETGGDDVRTDIGCRAEILEADRLNDGRWSVVARGVDRLRVDHWLPDDPYPRAVVSAMPDAPTTVLPAAAFDELVAAFRTLVGLIERRTGRVDLAPGVPLSNDHEAAVFEIATAAPIGEFDMYRVLSAPTLEERRIILTEALAHASIMLSF